MEYDWFYGMDLAIELFSAAVLGLAAILALGYSRLRRGAKYNLLISALSMLAISYVLKFCAYGIIYLGLEGWHVMALVSAHLGQAGLIVVLILFAYRLISLFALYLLYTVYADQNSRIGHLLLIYLVIITAFLAHIAYYIYHLTALIILVAIVLSLVKRYESYDSKRVLLVTSFITLGLSQVLFILMGTHAAFYILAELVKLVSFVMLLAAIVKVQKDAKKG